MLRVAEKIVLVNGLVFEGVPFFEEPGGGWIVVEKLDCKSVVPDSAIVFIKLKR